MMLKVSCCSHQGCVRGNNEDNFYVNGRIRADLSKGESFTEQIENTGRVLFAICDGMGGESYGEQASLAAVSALETRDQMTAQQDAEQNVRAANAGVLEIQEQFNCTTAGTTLTAMSIEDDNALVYNIGDSRIYLLRDNTLSRLTKDDTMANYLIETGTFTEEQTKGSPAEHMLTQYIGLGEYEGIDPHISAPFRLLDGDRFLLCSDGLYDMVSDEQMKELMMQETVEESGQQLLNTALQNGGADNTTVIVIEIIM